MVLTQTIWLYMKPSMLGYVIGDITNNMEVQWDTTVDQSERFDKKRDQYETQEYTNKNICLLITYKRGTSCNRNFPVVHYVGVISTIKSN